MFSPQVAPLNPSTQVHVKESMPWAQVPPFSHGFDKHSSKMIQICCHWAIIVSFSKIYFQRFYLNAY